MRAVGRRRPVLAAGVGRAGGALDHAALALFRDAAASRRGAGLVGLDVHAGVIGSGPPVLVQALRPVQLLHELGAPDVLAVAAVQRVGEAVAVGVQRGAHVLAVDVGIDEGVLRDGIEIVGIVRRVLESPQELAGIGIQGDGAVGPQVVARAIGVIPVRTGIGRAPDDDVEFGVIGARHPGGAAAGLPGAVVVLPGFVTRLARPRNGVGAPDFLAGVHVQRRDPAAHAKLGAGHAGQHHVLDDQRRVGDDLGDAGVGHLGFPQQAAVVLVEGENAAVDHRAQNLVAVQGDAAVVDTAAGDAGRPVLVGLGIVLPHQHGLAAAHVQLGDDAPAAGDVQEAVFRDGRAFQAGEREDDRRGAAAVDVADGPGERHLQVRDVGLVDLREAREAVRLIIAVVIDPVAGFVLTVDQALVRHVARHGGHGENGAEQHGQNGPMGKFTNDVHRRPLLLVNHKNSADTA